MTRPSPVRWILPVAAALGLGPAAPRPSRATADDEQRPAKGTLTEVAWPTAVGEGLDRYGLRLFGWTEASLGTTPTASAATRPYRVFDDRAEGVRFHASALGLERVPTSGFDAGFRLLGLYGTDARFLHARGLFDDQAGSVEQFDVIEAHALLRAPLADGLVVKVGRFVTPLGAEVIDAPNDRLASRSLLFGYAIPFAHAGALATLSLAETTAIGYGVVLGWDVYDDPNDAVSHLATFAWTSPSGDDALALAGIVGAERPDDDDALRLVVDATWTHVLSDTWTTVVNLDAGFEEGGAADGGDATFGGLALYATHRLSERLAATLRVEAFCDPDGARLGGPELLGEVTFGLDWTPFDDLPGFHVRPEVRWDRSFDGRVFDDGRARDQVSLAIDLVFAY